MQLDIVSVLKRIDKCCTENFELTDGKNFLELPITCNNRICNNSVCQEHRGKLHVKNHDQQIQFLQKYTTSPKAWVFTGWVLNDTIENIRIEGRKQLIRLMALLTRYSKTPFSVYLEYHPKEDGSYYLHFHAVGGSFGDIHLIQALWGRKVMYEYPASPNLSAKALYSYIRKYTSKTPMFYNEQRSVEYLQLVYKAQMCRYSVPRKDAINEFGVESSGWILISRAVAELKNAFQQGRIRDSQGLPMDFIPYVDPPPFNYQPPDDLPSSVYCPEFLVSKKTIKIQNVNHPVGQQVKSFPVHYYKPKKQIECQETLF